MVTGYQEGYGTQNYLFFFQCPESLTGFLRYKYLSL